MTPTARTLQYLRKANHEAGVVEKWNPHSKTRHDLFGVFDIVAITDEAVVGIQCTSGSNHSARVNKMADCAVLWKWLARGCKAEVWSWRKAANGRYKRRVTEMELVK